MHTLKLKYGLRGIVIYDTLLSVDCNLKCAFCNCSSCAQCFCWRNLVLSFADTYGGAYEHAAEENTSFFRTAGAASWMQARAFIVSSGNLGWSDENKIVRSREDVMKSL